MSLANYKLASELKKIEVQDVVMTRFIVVEVASLSNEVEGITERR